MSATRRAELARRIRVLLAERPHSVYEVLRALPDEDYRTVLQAWGDVRAEVTLVPDARGRYRPPADAGGRPGGATRREEEGPWRSGMM
jgi:hypothetical protein